MNILDWIIIAWLVIAFLSGARLGLVYRIGHVVGFVGGLWLAVRYQDVIAQWFGGGLSWRIGSFMTILIVVAELAGVFALLLDKFFRIFSWIPLLKSANAILGGVLSVVGNAAIISVVLYFANHYAVSPVFRQTVGESTLAAPLYAFGSWVATFIPFV